MNGSLQTWLVRAWHRVLFRWRRDQMYRDLEEELSFHHEQTQGVQQMGNVTLAKEECREMWSFMAFERLLQDLRYAFRMYGRTPVFTGISVLSLALGIGGNAAMFSLVNTLLVRPLPYAQPDRLLRITGIYPRAALPFYQGQSHTMDIAAVSRGSKFNLTGQGQATRVTASIASPNFLSVLGTSVARGRNFVSGEESPGRDSVVILSHSLWRDRFGSDPSVLGRVVRVNDVDRQIVGIMPAGFSYPSAKVQLLIPMRLDPSNFVEYWGTEFMPLLARLRPATTLAAAQREVHNLMDEFRGKFPYPMARDFNQDATAIPLQQDIVGDVRGKLIILLASVALVLFIACANVASLLLSRATTRRRELALRAALGASRLRMIRQLLTESIGLALTGAAIGIVLGTGALSIFKSLLPSSLPGLAQATIDWQIVAAVSALALLTGLASGIAPALSASQVDIAETIKTGSQRSTSGLWTRVRSLILAGEVALTLVLLGQRRPSAAKPLRAFRNQSGLRSGACPHRPDQPESILLHRARGLHRSVRPSAGPHPRHPRCGGRRHGEFRSSGGTPPHHSGRRRRTPQDSRSRRSNVLVWRGQSGVFPCDAHSAFERTVSRALRWASVGWRRSYFGIHGKTFLAARERHWKAH
jgi:hypothetical protein